MFEEVDIQDQLLKQKLKGRKHGDHLLAEANRILHEDLFTEKKILANLSAYNRSHEVLDEEVLDPDQVFTPEEIKMTCIAYRLKFLDSKYYKHQIPYAAIAKIKFLNEKFKKEVKYFKLIATHDTFRKDTAEERLLLAKTNNENYYVIHRWGQKLKWNRKLKYWPMRNFENLFTTVAFMTLVITMSLPTGFISLDDRVGYWSGFRAAAFFHLFIFNLGVTAYIGFAFTKNFSSSIWDQPRDFV